MLISGAKLGFAMYAQGHLFVGLIALIWGNLPQALLEGTAVSRHATCQQVLR